jgi:hypothetical protein
MNTTPEAAIWACVPHLIVVTTTSRVAARFTNPSNAVLVSGAALGAAYLLLVWLERNRIDAPTGGQPDV